MKCADCGKELKKKEVRIITLKSPMFVCEQCLYRWQEDECKKDPNCEGVI